MKDKIIELLLENHPNEIGRLVDMSCEEAKKIVREIYFEWGYTDPNDWEVQDVGDGHVLFLKQGGDDWIDEDGNYRFFDSKKEALKHLHKSLKLWHDKVALNTYS